MTDEERARYFVRRYGQSEKLFHDFLKAAAAIRADEREKAAKKVEGLMKPARGMPVLFDTGRFNGLEEAADAIRARGSE